MIDEMGAERKYGLATLAMADMAGQLFKYVRRTRSVS
jgi:hypothetical protein